MHRRQFIESVTGALATGALVGCVPGGRRGTTSTLAAHGDLTARDYRATRRYAETTFGRIAYVERGAGEAALFLHGFPLNGFQWRGALARLSAHRRCVAPDFLGLGYTEVRDGAPVGPDAQAAMLVELMDRLGIGAADIVANDSGGAVAQLLVVRHPTRMRSLLLTNCDVENDSPPSVLLPVIELARAGKFAAAWLAPWHADPTLARSPQGLGGLTYTDPRNLTDDAIAYYLSPLVETARGQALVNAYAVSLAPNPLAGIERELRRSPVPMRVVWGTSDSTFKQESPEYLHRVFGNSKGVRRVPGAKLFFPEEYPELMADEARGVWEVGGG